MGEVGPKSLLFVRLMRSQRTYLLGICVSLHTNSSIGAGVWVAMLDTQSISNQKPHQ